MTLFKDKYRVESIRLPGYDYSQPGAYFITIVTHNRQCSFGNIIDDEMMLNEFGVLVQNEWLKTGIIRPNINIDAFVVMPNHLHGIIIITDNDNGHSRDSRDSRDSRRDTLQRVSTITDTITDTDTDTITDTEMGTETDTGTIEQFGKPTKNSIPTIVRSFKSTTTKQINQMRQTPMQPLWQRNYFEHVIRDDNELTRIHQYIINNSKRWEEDNLNKFL
ncbi:MAG: transposase [Candidatus Marinimicrobia bacterium]|nr:transposase [Candidatus Neomarinimicrobiota bacterium]